MKNCLIQLLTRLLDKRQVMPKASRPDLIEIYRLLDVLSSRSLFLTDASGAEDGRVDREGRQGSSRQDAGPADLLDLLLGLPGEEPGLDDDGLLGQDPLAQDLEVPGAANVDDGRLALDGGLILVLDPGLLGHQGPQLVQVDGGAEVVGVVRVEVKVPHADLAEVARVVLVEVDAVVVHAAGVAPTSGMLPVLADTTVAMGHVSAELPGLLLVGAHLVRRKNLQHNRERD